MTPTLGSRSAMQNLYRNSMPPAAVIFTNMPEKLLSRLLSPPHLLPVSHQRLLSLHSSGHISLEKQCWPWSWFKISNFVTALQMALHGWIQLGPDINDEELADLTIRCVETIIAGDFSTAVRCNTLEPIVPRAFCLLCQVSSLIVIGDVSGPRAQRAFATIISALGSSSVALYTSPVDGNALTGDILSLRRVICWCRC